MIVVIIVIVIIVVIVVVIIIVVIIIVIIIVVVIVIIIVVIVVIVAAPENFRASRPGRGGRGRYSAGRPQQQAAETDTVDPERLEQARLRGQVGKVSACLLQPPVPGFELLDILAGFGLEQPARRRDRLAIAALATERRGASQQHQLGPARRRHGEIERRA
jgi:hypothetical protein